MCPSRNGRSEADRRPHRKDVDRQVSGAISKAVRRAIPSFNVESADTYQTQAANLFNRCEVDADRVAVLYSTHISLPGIGRQLEDHHLFDSGSLREIHRCRRKTADGRVGCSKAIPGSTETTTPLIATGGATGYSTSNAVQAVGPKPQVPRSGPHASAARTNAVRSTPAARNRASSIAPGRRLPPWRARTWSMSRQQPESGTQQAPHNPTSSRCAVFSAPSSSSSKRSSGR